MNNWTVVGPKSRSRPKTKSKQHQSKSKSTSQTPKYNTTHKNERLVLKSINSTYSNTGKKNPRHGQGNRKVEGGVRSFNRSQTKKQHFDPKIAIILEILNEKAKSPEKLKNLQSALKYEEILRNIYPHGSSKGQQQARERVKFEKTKVNNAIKQTFINSRPSHCPTAPKSVKQKQLQRSLSSSAKCALNF